MNQDNDNQNPLTDHTYDGITEYDNPTPGWWTWLFIITIGFSVVYFFVVTLAQSELTPRGFYARAKTEAQKQLMSKLGELTADDKTILKLAGDAEWLPVGESLYATNCASCHGGKGEGQTGPNLTDETYIYVSTPADFADVVVNGRKNGAMPAWRNRLEPTEIVMVSAYVASLRGKNLPGRAVEGEKRPAVWTVEGATPGLAAPGGVGSGAVAPGASVPAAK